MSRIGLLSLLVNDYDEGIAFFTRCLGFDLIEDSDLGDGKRWVVVGPSGREGMAILLAQPSNELQRSHVGIQAGGRVAFFLYTDDFAGEHERMIESGVRFLEAPRVERYGTVAVFEDCSGNRWDLIEERLDAAAAAAVLVGQRSGLAAEADPNTIATNNRCVAACALE